VINYFGEKMSVVIFPHIYLPESITKKVIDVFGPIEYFQPWFLESEDFIRDLPVEVSNPLERDKPDVNFRSLLSEYKSWATQNRDRSYLENIKSDKGNKAADNTTWEIRQMLNNAVKKASDSGEKKILQSHLILHFFKEIEEQYNSLDGILKRLKQKDHLLKGSVERSDEIVNLLRDLPPSEQELYLKDDDLDQINEAWFSLFNGFLEKGDVLVTYNEHIMTNIADKWENISNGDIRANYSDVKFRVPNLSLHSQERQMAIREKYDIDEKMNRIKDLIINLHKSPLDYWKNLEEYSIELENSFPWELSEHILRLTLKPLFVMGEKGFDKESGLLNYLFNKTLILAEE
jgi:hypothetical protein